jgi:PAS domain S-box-containing protein
MLASVRDVTTRYEQRRVLNSLHDVTTELMRAPTKEAIAEVTTTAAQQVFDDDIAGVRLLHEEPTPETLELVAATDETYELLDAEPTAYNRNEGVVGRTFEQQEPTTLDDIHSDETPFDYGPIRSVMCFPLGAHGVLSVGATEPGAFDETDVELTNILATNATAALTRAQREEDLSERTERLSGLFENATDCIADVKFVDGAPRIRDVNAEFERVFGYEAEAIRGQSLTELVVPPEEDANSQSLVDQGLAGRRIETEGKRETATGRRDFLIRVVPIQQNGDNIGAYVVYTDITKQKRRDQQLQVLNRVLRHNIRNKLNVVKGVLERTLGSNKKVPESLGENGLDAVDELLDLSETARKLSTETRPKNNPAPVSTTEIVEQTVSSLRESHPEASIRLDDAPETWVAGTVQLDRALRELCENAIEHTTQATPSVQVSVVIEHEEDGWVTITVEDEGPGIPDEQLTVLRNGEETQLEHGNGLGLWSVQWIVQSAGGELTFATRDDEGTVVTMRLPTVRPAAHPRDVQGSDSIDD